MDVENLTGHMVNGYMIGDPINTTSGEAILYMCEKDGKEYVFKIYKEQDSLKEEVAQILLQNPSKHLARVYEVDKYGDCTYEIMDYYPEGSLHGKRFTYEELRDIYIPRINEAIHELHKTDIVHRDLKPANLMIHGDDIVLIDFGVSSVLEDNQEAIATKSGITHVYSAPESIIGNVSLKISDYYSFGVIIYELFTGQMPANERPKNSMNVTNLNLNARFAMPDDMPNRLKELIWGLTFKEIGTKKNSNEYVRWSYKEVCDWVNEKDETNGQVEIADMPASQQGLHWKKHHYESVDKLAGKMYEALLLDNDVYDTTTGEFSEYIELFRMGLVSEFVRKEMPGRKSAILRAEAIEEEVQSGTQRLSRESILDAYLLIFTMVRMSVMEFDGRQFTTIDEFAGYVERSLVNGAFQPLNDFCHKLWNGEEMPLNIEAFFIAEGGQKEIDKLYKAMKARK